MEDVVFAEVFPITGLAKGVLAVSYGLVVYKRGLTFKSAIWSNNAVLCNESRSTESIKWITIKQCRRIANP